MNENIVGAHCKRCGNPFNFDRQSARTIGPPSCPHCGCQDWPICQVTPPYCSGQFTDLYQNVQRRRNSSKGK